MRSHHFFRYLILISAFLLVGFIGPKSILAEEKVKIHLPQLTEEAALTFAPQVPPPIHRKQPAVVVVHLTSGVKQAEIKSGETYQFWTFNDHVPGPMIRARVGDTLEIHHKSTDASGMPHNVDLHAVTGPGGGAPVTTVVKGDERIAWFKLLQPGLYVYHCAAPPVMDHIANGMYGMILVEPQKGLPKVDREFYVMQSEFYTNKKIQPQPDGHNMEGTATKKEDKDDFWGEGAGEDPGPQLLLYSHNHGLDEHPTYVVFNGKVGSLIGEGALKAKVGDRVRIYFGNGGPNLISSFHVIGEIFENVYREGDLISSPAHSVQTTLVPAGGSTVVDFKLEVPGDYTLVDHAIFRVEQGAVGFLKAEGPADPQIYASDQDAVVCKGCLVHP